MQRSALSSIHICCSVDHHVLALQAGRKRDHSEQLVSNVVQLRLNVNFLCSVEQVTSKIQWISYDYVAAFDRNEVDYSA